MQFNIYFVFIFAASCGKQAYCLLDGYAYDQEDIHYRNPICQHRNAFYEVQGSCDAYIECLDYTALHRRCLDGMHFNSKAVWPEYPCGYPSDVPCQARTSTQAASPTEGCPHQYGLFASPLLTPVECRHYFMCVAGKPFPMMCSEALAFNPKSGRCDWPDLVPSCNADEFLHFKCPPEPVDEDNKPLDIVVNYKYPSDCFRFFSCRRGVARLLSCDIGFAFDPATGRCENSEYTRCNV